MLAPSTAVAAPEPVAEVGPAWSLVWVSREPIAHILARHPEVRIGTKLYAKPVAAPTVQPLTDEQVAEACGWKAGMGCKPLPRELQIARAIERAHGIADTAAPKENGNV